MSQLVHTWVCCVVLATQVTVNSTKNGDDVVYRNTHGVLQRPASTTSCIVVCTPALYSSQSAVGIPTGLTSLCTTTWSRYISIYGQFNSWYNPASEWNHAWEGCRKGQIMLPEKACYLRKLLNLFVCVCTCVCVSMCVCVCLCVCVCVCVSEKDER